MHSSGARGCTQTQRERERARERESKGASDLRFKRAIEIVCNQHVFQDLLDIPPSMETGWPFFFSSFSFSCFCCFFFLLRQLRAFLQGFQLLRSPESLQSPQKLSVRLLSAIFWLQSELVNFTDKSMATCLTTNEFCSGLLACLVGRASSEQLGHAKRFEAKGISAQNVQRRNRTAGKLPPESCQPSLYFQHTRSCLLISFVFCSTPYALETFCEATELLQSFFFGTSLFESPCQAFKLKEWVSGSV